jgi:hypothetical protein
MFVRQPKHCSGTMEGDKESLVDSMRAILCTKDAQSRPDSPRNRNCTKKLLKNAQLCLL